MRVARPAGYAVGMKTAVSIPDDIFERAECLASQERRSRSEVHAMALQEHLVRHLRDEVTETMNRACDRARSHRMVISQGGARSLIATVAGYLRRAPCCCPWERRAWPLVPGSACERGRSANPRSTLSRPRLMPSIRCRPTLFKQGFWRADARFPHHRSGARFRPGQGVPFSIGSGARCPDGQSR